VSAEAVGATAAMPPGELVAAERVQQLQALIAQTRQLAASGSLPSASASSAAPAPQQSFADALQAASGSAGATPAAAATGSDQYEAQIAQAAERNGIEPALLHGLIQQESAFDPNSTSSAGAEGLTQLMPGTAASLGVTNPLDPAESIEGGARYLSQMMAKFGGNASDALAAYNAGPGAVAQYGGVPPYAETQSYVSKVLGYAEAYRQEHPAPAAIGSVA
jgi:soluble lytic murein transglycosylase-like protein